MNPHEIAKIIFDRRGEFFTIGPTDSAGRQSLFAMYEGRWTKCNNYLFYAYICNICEGYDINNISIKDIKANLKSFIALSSLNSGRRRSVRFFSVINPYEALFSFLSNNIYCPSDNGYFSREIDIVDNSSYWEGIEGLRAKTEYCHCISWEDIEIDFANFLEDFNILGRDYFLNRNKLKESIKEIIKNELTERGAEYCLGYVGDEIFHHQVHEIYSGFKYCYLLSKKDINGIAP